MGEARGRPEVRLFAELARAAQLAASRTERLLPEGLSGAGFETLKLLADAAAPLSPIAIAAALGVSKGAVTNTLQKLEGRGWIAVGADAADGRRKQVGLTSAGQAACRAAFVATRPELDALRTAFAPAEFEAALPFLHRLSAWLAGRG
jgi:DNA-binding MarR family transcriptional regulator